MSWRILRALEHRGAAPAGDRLHTNAVVLGRGAGGPKSVERKLSARVLGPIQSVKLYDLDGADAVEQLAADMKTFWQRHAVTAPSD